MICEVGDGQLHCLAYMEQNPTDRFFDREGGLLLDDRIYPTLKTKDVGSAPHSHPRNQFGIDLSVSFQT